MDKKIFSKKQDYNKGKERTWKKNEAVKPALAKDDNNNDDSSSLLLIGRNPVLEALNNGGDIDRILIKKGEDGKLEGTLRVISAKAKERGIVIQEVAKEKLDALCVSEGDTKNHQGVIALCPAYAYAEVSDILDIAKEKNEDPFIVILDEISDPHNLGAIIRTADACGAHGVIIPKRRACGLTSTVVRTSAGAAAYVKIARVTNISNTIEELKKNGVWIACADMSGENLYKAPLTGALAIVVGGEGEGVGPLIKKKCDFAVKIPMRGKISSLNASVAAAVVMYEVVRRKTE